MHADDGRLTALSGVVVGRAFTARNTPGAGFVAKVHGTALTHEVARPALPSRSNAP